MKNETDIYLSLKLKNWAARQSPPDNGRGRLLSQIALSEALEDMVISSPGTVNGGGSKKNQKLAMERFRGSLTGAHLWSLPLDPTCRLVS